MITLTNNFHNTKAQIRAKTSTKGGYIYLAAVGCPTLKIAVDSADMASGQMEGYIRHYNLGGSQLKRNCGTIYGNDGVPVARVSYNGRVWDMENNLIQEIRGGHPFPVPAERNRTL